MTIPELFNQSWEDLVTSTAMCDNVEIFPEQRIIINMCDVHGYTLGDLCVVYGDNEYPQFISSRFPPDAILLPAYLHIRMQMLKFKKLGITTTFIRESGLIQCIYKKPSPASDAPAS